MKEGRGFLGIYGISQINLRVVQIYGSTLICEVIWSSRLDFIRIRSVVASQVILVGCTRRSYKQGRTNPSSVAQLNCNNIINEIVQVINYENL